MTLLVLSLLATAHAGSDRLYISNFDDQTVEVYHAGAGVMVDLLPLDATALERSAPGGVVYARHNGDQLSLVRVRDNHIVRSPDLLGQGAHDIAVSFADNAMYSPQGDGVETQDAAGAGYVTTTIVVPGGTVGAVATTTDGRIYAWDENSRDLLELDPQTHSVQMRTNLDFVVKELAVSPYTDLVVAVGQGIDPESGAPVAHVATWDPNTGNTNTDTIAQAKQATSIAFDAINTGKFFVGTDAGYMPTLVTSNSLLFFPQIQGSPEVTDLASTDAGDLYVLYHDHVDLVNNNGTSSVVQFPGQNWHFQIVAVPTPIAESGLQPMHPFWWGLLRASEVLKVVLPWDLVSDTIPCAECDEDDMEHAQTAATARLKGRDALSVDEVVELLVKLSGEDEDLVRLYVDEARLNTNDAE